MFKSVFNQTMDPNELIPVELDDHKQEMSVKKSSNPVKKGRKKLSSMMNRLHVGRGRKSSNIGETNANQSDDDDDEWHSGDDGDSNGGDQTNEGANYVKGQARRRSSQHNNRRRSSLLKATEKEQQEHGALGNDDEDDEDEERKCVLPEEECDIPTFLETKNAPLRIIEETRRLLKERYTKNPNYFYESDYQRMLADDWTVTRFLLRRHLDPKRTAKLMEECGKFRKNYKMSELQLWEFPREFHQAGGLFKYAPDRVGNLTMYMRIKMYRRVPEISELFKAFILCVLEQCDVANGGRGTAVVFDLSGCGLQNVDLGFLSWLLSSFRNYCPKGVSYILVLNLPWILNATCKLAMSWMSHTNRRALRFVQGNGIEEFIARENLPDYLGGSCKINYRAVPPGSLPAIETCHKFDLTQKQALKIRELFKEYLNDADDQNESEESHQAAKTNDNDGVKQHDSDGAPPLGFVAQTTRFAQ